MKSNSMLVLSFITLFVWSGLVKANDQNHFYNHGGMRISLPEKAQRDVVDLGDGTKQNRLIINDPSGSIIVWHQKRNPDVDVAVGLARAQATIEKMAGGKTLTQELKNDEGVSSRSFRVTIPSKAGEFRVSYYQANDKNYQVMAVGSPEFTSSTRVNKMFASVKFN